MCIRGGGWVDPGGPLQVPNRGPPILAQGLGRSVVAEDSEAPGGRPGRLVARIAPLVLLLLRLADFG